MKTTTQSPNSGVSGRLSHPTFVVALLSTLLLPFIPTAGQAGSATWNLNPTSGSWNTAANWTPATVPNGASDTATFAVSNTTAISLSASVEVNGIVYNPGASAFTTSITSSQILTISGLGITNNSGVSQNFSVATNPAEIIFTNSATAGTQTTFTTAGGVSNFTGGGRVVFFDNSTAVDSVFVNNGGTVSGSFGGSVAFTDSANAGNVVITNHGRGITTASGGGKTTFSGSATAGNATITNEPNGQPILTVSGGDTEFFDAAIAGNSTITNEGATVSGQIGGGTNFEGNSSADNATIICNGGQVAGAGGGIVHFVEGAKSANATLIANAGVNGGDGGQIQLVGRPQVDAARVKLFGNGALVITSMGARTVGSVEGTGIVDLSIGTFASLSVGSNNLSTTFSGTIQGTGSFVKTGTGTLKLSGTNTYTGATVVSGGALIFANTATLATSFVEVDAGTLGGGATIPSQLNVGNGGTQGQAFLAPAAGSKKQMTIIVQGELFMQTGGTYTCTFKAKQRRVRTDQVIANGVVLIASAPPTISIQGTIQGMVALGTTFTIISNTSANPIDGTFSNLPDGAVVTIGGNNFQADYQGGDGNDLTLTVVP